MLVGGRTLWRTNDVRAPNTPDTGPEWLGIKASTGSSISAIAVVEGDPDVIWVGHNSGEVYVTVDGTTDLTDSNGWVVVQGAVTGSNGVTTVTDTDNFDARDYRIRVHVP